LSFSFHQKRGILKRRAKGNAANIEKMRKGGSMKKSVAVENHEVKWHEEYQQYAPYCSCGQDSVVCQVCGKVVCGSQIKTVRGKNTCEACEWRMMPRPNLKGNPAYDLMM